MNGSISLHHIILPMQTQGPTMDDLILGLPLAQRVPVVALNSLLKQREQVDDQQEIEIQRVHKHYADKIKPLLERASQLIQGKDPLPAELEALPNYLKAGEKAPAIKGKVIDRYWNAALQNSGVANFITEKDEKALEYLQDIQLVEGAPDGIALKFIFKANPYFNETVLTRKLVYANGKPFGIDGDVPTWKTGNWLTHQSKKANNKTTGLSKVLQGKKIDSFFDVFLNWNVNENPDEFDKCHQIIEELVTVIKDSLGFFLGLFEMAGSEDEDEDEYEDEEDEEEEEAPKKGKK